MSILLPSRQRRQLKSWLKWLRRSCVRRWCSFDRADLLHLFERLGVRSGDALLVHASFDRFEGFLGKPTDVITALEEAVGPGGTILMPTLPFTGTAVDYVAGGKIFDVLRTPSSMGLLSEMFRRSPGVVRSVHPTHSVAAWGTKAEEMVIDHHMARTPCGVGTPFYRLIEQEAKMLFLGIDINAMTLFHTVEELLEPRMPFSPFTKEVFCLKSRDPDGKILVTTTRLLDPYWSRRRNLDKLVPVLRTRGAWRSGKCGILKTILLDCNEVLK